MAGVTWRSGTTAIAIGLGLGGFAGPGHAAEVGTGGGLAVSIAGFAGMLAYGGALARQNEDPDLADGLDFSNDTEVHVLVKGRAEELGLEYGATIEFEADTDETINTDETWLFLRSGWGEARLGDVDGPVDASSLGAFTIAAGTGGIDGDVVSTLTVDAILPITSDTATKIRYYTPAVAGLQLGLSYAPTAFDDAGSSVARTDAEIEHWVEAALIYEAEFDRFDLVASLVGSVADVKDDELPDDRLWTAYAGANLSFDELELGAGLGAEDAGGQRRRYANVGAGRSFGPVYTSITHGRVLDSSGYDGVGEPWNLVLSADLELAPGLLLAGDAAYFDNDLDASARNVTGGDRGWVWVAKLEVVF
ncbi:MAG: porin [Geminicoccaceae bacterium]